MTIEGKVKAPKGRKNKLWSAEISLLGIYTQGKSKQDAFRMIADAIESLVDKTNFKVLVDPREANAFSVTSEDSATFLAFLLGRLRSTHQLSARTVAKRLNATSPNSYARYEQGRAIPKLDTLEELLKAVNPNIELVLKSA